MSSKQADSVDKTCMNRRNFMRLTAAGVGTAAAGAGADRMGLEPVGEAEAIAPIVLVGGAVAASAVSGWALREFEVIGKDDPPEGLTVSALEDRVAQTVKTRKSTNASTFVDNRNIITSGLPHTLYSEGKMAAIDALNNQKTQSEVQTAAINAYKDYLTTIETNLLKSWNESVLELDSLRTALADHPDTAVGNVLAYKNDNGVLDSYAPEAYTTTQVTLTDGSTFDLHQVNANGGSQQWTPLSDSSDGDAGVGLVNETSVSYLEHTKWNGVWSDIQSVGTDVNNGLITCVENIYSSVQSGDIDTSGLLTSRELAAMDSGDETAYNQAIRDLMALNVASAPSTEVTIELSSVGATLTGKLAITGESTVSTGSIDPTADSNSYYFTYDISEGTGVWSDYNTGVDGGNVTFTAEPFEQTVYLVNTSAGETAELMASDFTDNGDGTFTASISSKVETAITNIESVEYYAETEETQYETVQLLEPFEVVKIENKDGEEVESADYTKQNQPHDDTNYITQEEWEQQQQKYQDMIDQYEEAKAGGGMTFSPEDFAFAGIPGVAVLGGIGVSVLGALGIASK